jgi:hypothetical protein
MAYYHWLGRESEEIASANLRELTQRTLDDYFLQEARIAFGQTTERPTREGVGKD